MPIRVGVLKVDFLVTDAQSLKEKRFVMNRLRDRVRSAFNVSISQMEHQDKWQIASFGISCISNDKRHLDAREFSTLDGVQDGLQVGAVTGN